MNAAVKILYGVSCLLNILLLLSLWVSAVILPYTFSKYPLDFQLPVSLTSEQTTLTAITQHVWDEKGIRPSQHGFMKSRSCSPNLITCYDQVTHLVNEGKAADGFCPDFSKASSTVSHSILLQKLAAHGLDRCTLCLTKNWLDGQAQRVVVNGAELNPAQRSVMSGCSPGVRTGACPV